MIFLISNITFRMNVTDSDNDMGNFEEGNRDKIRLRIIFMCFAIGVGVGVMACVHVGRKVSLPTSHFYCTGTF